VSVIQAPRSRGIALATGYRLVGTGALGVALVAVQLSVRGETDLRDQVLAQLLAFAVFLPAAWLLWNGLRAGRAGLVLVVGIAIALNAAALVPGSPPPLTTDTYRYAWDARVQAAGINPYRFAPSSPVLAELRDDTIWPNVNRKDWATVYPPGAEATFLASRVLFGNGIRATTWLFLFAEALAIGLLVATLARVGAPLERVGMLAWHPLAVNEIAANGHSDALAVLACAGLLAAWAYGRRGLAGLAVGAGALVKLGPILLVAALARAGGRRFVLAALGLVVAGYAVYASAGTRVVGSFFRYLDREDLGSLAWWWLNPYLGRDGARTLLAIALLAVVALVALRAHDTLDQVARSGLLVLGGALLAAAYLQPWYALWLLPFLCITAAPGWLWLTGTVPLLYVFGIDDVLPGWVRVAIYVPFVTFALGRLVIPRRVPLVVPEALPHEPRIAVVIPVLDEVEALPGVLREIPAGVVSEVVVVDGGSQDGTVEVARQAGARVLVETRRGYGRACLAGAQAADADVLVWLDGDGSDDPAALGRLLEPILVGDAVLSLGIRSDLEAGAQHRHQRLGNRLVSLLVRLTTGVAVRDIPPMRALRADALSALALTELTYGWPTEMVVKAARAGLPIAQVEVPSRARRGGRSKVSGRLGPSARAGLRMLGVVARHA
jgi:hypothetical protein